MKHKNTSLTKQELLQQVKEVKQIIHDGNNSFDVMRSLWRAEREKIESDLHEKWRALDFFRSTVVPLLLNFLSLENKKLFLSRLVSEYRYNSEIELKRKFEELKYDYHADFVGDLIHTIGIESIAQQSKLKDSFLEKEKNEKRSLLNNVNVKFSDLSIELQTFYKKYFVLTYGTDDLSLLTYKDLLDILFKIS